MIKHTFGNGKYEVIFHDTGRLEAYRNGELWQDLTGDGLTLAMLQDYDFEKEQNDINRQQINSLLSEIDFLKMIVNYT
ncbi:MAG: hypothetical protein ACXW2E_01145 [Nitrososphaeraceae archaeon]